ncbi:MAG TPA: hypothetical protein VEK73_09765 [Xanthobacteraceae bacterium]|nr:hypothetical protein [Xanthobacteraceae bacterium]
MWDLLGQQSFQLGAALVLIYQAAKFRELNRTDPVTSHYVALLPGAQVRDFAGPYEYRFALFAFLAASLVAYFLFCHVSPDVLAGAGKMLHVENADTLIEGVPYPLYIAALFVGLTQPIIPGLAQFEEAQRNFFHDRIEVPRRVIDLSESLMSAIDARTGSDRQKLADEVRKLVSPDFLSSLQRHGDLAFYRTKIDELNVGNGDLESAIADSSTRELRGLIERLVLCALVAAMRKSGSNSLITVAESLGAPPAIVPNGRVRGFLTGLIASGLVFGFGLLVIAHVLSWLNGPVSDFFDKSPDQTLWPNSLESVGQELLGIVPPIVVCIAIAVIWIVPRGPIEVRRGTDEADASLFVEFLNFFQARASVFGLCMVTAVLIKLGQMFAEFGSLHVPSDALSVMRLILPVIQSFIGVTVCVLTTWHLVSHHDGVPHRGLSFTGTLLMIALATGVIAFFYDQTFLAEYLRVRPQDGPGWEHVFFSVLANVLVSICAFASVAVFFKARQSLREPHNVAAGQATAG